jgi:hypothetical protein
LPSESSLARAANGSLGQARTTPFFALLPGETDSSTQRKCVDRHPNQLGHFTRLVGASQRDGSSSDEFPSLRRMFLPRRKLIAPHGPRKSPDSLATNRPR